MVTKSKKFLKRLVYIICLAIIAGIISTAFYLHNNLNNGVEILTQNDYYQSVQLKENTSSNIQDLSIIMHRYKSKEYIEAGNTVFKQKYDLPYAVHEAYESFKDEYITTNEQATEESIVKSFVKEHFDLVKEEYQININTHLNYYTNILNDLDQNGVKYYIAFEDNELTNVPGKSKSFFTSSKVYFAFDEAGSETSFDDLDLHLMNDLQLNYMPQEVLYLTYDVNYLNAKAHQWHIETSKFKPSFVLLIVLAGLSFICFLYLGHQYKEEYFPWLSFEIPLDLLLGINSIIIVVALVLSYDYYAILGQYLTIPLTVLISFLVVNYYLRIIKPNPSKPYYKRFLILIMLQRFLIWFLTMLSKLPTIIRMLPTPYKAKDLKNILKGLDRIQLGDSDYKIETKTKGIYKELADGINHMSDGLKHAVERKVKSERLKTELITNVSHDIRTPLTSIITYIDLIQKTDDLEEQKKYFEIIEQKSLRLKALTDSLFDAAKINSGNMDVNFENIDIQSLLTQAFGELSDKMSDSKLEFITNFRHQTKIVKADGKLLFRVIENLMSNILKYAQRNSRVYISVEEDDKNHYMVFKNISEMQLNVSPEELFERFTRGEASRTTEGNGLGLSITRQLMEVQNGKANISIDGDLFKVVISLPKAIE